MAGALTAAIAAAFAGGVTADPYFEYTTLLLPGSGTNGAQNNTFLDGSTNNFTITRNGNTTQGTFSPFSQTGWSGSFNTSTTYLTVTDTSNLRFGSSNFTIEAFVYRAASGATQTIASKGASTPTGWVFQISSADKLVFTDTSTSITGATSLAANTWYYVAVVRAGTGSNQTTLYVNAVSDATGTSATTFSQTDNMKIGADRSNTNFANGYISNLRLSNTNRTISSTPTSALAADSNTIFLGLYNNRFQYTDSTAAFTNMTVTGTPSVQAFSPFNPTSSWSATTNGGSGYFDGSGDYLSVADNDAFALGSNNWTIECWVYLTNTVSAAQSFVAQVASSGADATVGFVLGISSSGYPFIASYINGAYTAATASTAITTNQWWHIVGVRSSGTMSVFANGSRYATTSVTGSSVNSTAVVSIGASQSGSGALTTGYISSARIVNGTAVYDPTLTTLTVPTAPLTNITNTSLLLNFTNAGIYDATSKNDLETVGNAQISNAVTPQFGSTSIKFDGTGDCLIVPNSSIVSIQGDFTLESWVYLAAAISSGGYGTICSKYSAGSLGADDAWQWYIQNNAGTMQIVFGPVSGSSETTMTFIVTGASSTLNGVWNHIAVTRSGNSIRCFFNGTQIGTTQTYSSTINVGTNAVTVAARTPSSPDLFLNGYIQDLRVTTGYARYTANFTAPTAAFPTL
jgi:hypothetical protein